MNTSGWAIPVAFSFDVVIGDDTGPGDCAFSEVSGLAVQLAYDRVGDSDGQQNITPKPPVYSNLVLRRGLLRGAALTAWVADALAMRAISTKTVQVRLLDEAGAPQLQWTLFGAYPVAMRISPLNARQNELVMEEFELAYQRFERVDGTSSQ